MVHSENILYQLWLYCEKTANSSLTKSENTGDLKLLNTTTFTFFPVQRVTFEEVPFSVRVQVCHLEMELLVIVPDHFKMLLTLNKPPVTRWRASVQQPPASHEPLVGCWPPFINVGEITHVGSDLDGHVMGSTHN